MWADGRRESLSEFYAAVFAQILQASQSASKAKFEHAIDCVRNVRDAWREVAKDSNAGPDSPRVIPMPRHANADRRRRDDGYLRQGRAGRRKAASTH